MTIIFVDLCVRRCVAVLCCMQCFTLFCFFFARIKATKNWQCTVGKTVWESKLLSIRKREIVGRFCFGIIFFSLQNTREIVAAAHLKRMCAHYCASTYKWINCECWQNVVSVLSISSGLFFVACNYSCSAIYEQ